MGFNTAMMIVSRFKTERTVEFLEALGFVGLEEQGETKYIDIMNPEVESVYVGHIGEHLLIFNFDLVNRAYSIALSEKEGSPAWFESYIMELSPESEVCCLMIENFSNSAFYSLSSWGTRVRSCMISDEYHSLDFGLPLSEESFFRQNYNRDKAGNIAYKDPDSGLIKSLGQIGDSIVSRIFKRFVGHEFDEGNDATDDTIFKIFSYAALEHPEEKKERLKKEKKRELEGETNPYLNLPYEEQMKLLKDICGKKKVINGSEQIGKIVLLFAAMNRCGGISRTFHDRWGGKVFTDDFILSESRQALSNWEQAERPEEIGPQMAHVGYLLYQYGLSLD